MIALRPTAQPTKTSIKQQTYHFCVVCPNAQQIYLIGDFNNWSTSATPMQLTEPNVWQLSLQMREPIDGGRPARFSYFVIDRQWLTGRAAFGTTYCLPGTWSAVVRTEEAPTSRVTTAQSHHLGTN
jgi:1,4-alpha-glucan branching enzyme